MMLTIKCIFFFCCFIADLLEVLSLLVSLTLQPDLDCPVICQTFEHKVNFIKLHGKLLLTVGPGTPLIPGSPTSPCSAMSVSEIFIIMHNSKHNFH